MEKNQKQPGIDFEVVAEAFNGQLVGGFSMALTAASFMVVVTDPGQSNNCKGMNCVGCHAGE